MKPQLRELTLFYPIINQILIRPKFELAIKINITYHNN